jgi:hypothetical protein
MRARDFSESIPPFALPSGYSNMLGSDDHAQFSFSYRENAPTLLA